MRHPHSMAKWLLALLWLSFWPTPGFGVMAVPIPLPQLIAQSQVIVLGKAANSHSFWQGGRIMSLVEFHVAQVLKGDLHPGDVISILQLGGVVEHIGQQVHGVPKLEPEQTRIVHLRTTSTGEFQPAHTLAGYWEIAEDCLIKDCPIRHSLPHPQDPSTLRSLKEQIHAQQQD